MTLPRRQQNRLNRERAILEAALKVFAATGYTGTKMDAVAAEAGPGKTIAVVGDGAVGLSAVLAAKQLGAERIIAFSRHADRQALAREFGATDIIELRGDEGAAAVKELTGGYGAHGTVEAVGTQESMWQAIKSTRPGGHVGYVGVSHGVELDGQALVQRHGHAEHFGFDRRHAAPHDRDRDHRGLGLNDGAP